MLFRNRRFYDSSGEMIGRQKPTPPPPIRTVKPVEPKVPPHIYTHNLRGNSFNKPTPRTQPRRPPDYIGMNKDNHIYMHNLQGGKTFAQPSQNKAVSVSDVTGGQSSSPFLVFAPQKPVVGVKASNKQPSLWGRIENKLDEPLRGWNMLAQKAESKAQQWSSKGGAKGFLGALAGTALVFGAGVGSAMASAIAPSTYKQAYQALKSGAPFNMNMQTTKNAVKSLENPLNVAFLTGAVVGGLALGKAGGEVVKTLSPKVTPDMGVFSDEGTMVRRLEIEKPITEASNVEGTEVTVSKTLGQKTVAMETGVAEGETYRPFKPTSDTFKYGKITVDKVYNKPPKMNPPDLVERGVPQTREWSIAEEGTAPALKTKNSNVAPDYMYEGEIETPKGKWRYTIAQGTRGKTVNKMLNAVNEDTGKTLTYGETATLEGNPLKGYRFRYKAFMSDPEMLEEPIKPGNPEPPEELTDLINTIKNSKTPVTVLPDLTPELTVLGGAGGGAQSFKRNWMRNWVKNQGKPSTQTNPPPIGSNQQTSTSTANEETQQGVFNNIKPNIRPNMWRRYHDLSWDTFESRPRPPMVTPKPWVTPKPQPMPKIKPWINIPRPNYTPWVRPIINEETQQGYYPGTEGSTTGSTGSSTVTTQSSGSGTPPPPPRTVLSRGFPPPPVYIFVPGKGWVKVQRPKTGRRRYSEIVYPETPIPFVDFF